MLLIGTDGPKSFLGIAGPPVAPTGGVLSLIGSTTATTGLFEYLQDTTDYATNPAAVVAEGAAKPEWAATFTQKQAVAQTVAVWTAVIEAVAARRDRR